MDVQSTALYNDLSNSDDSLPDLATVVGLNAGYRRPNTTQSEEVLDKRDISRKEPPKGQENSTENNQTLPQNDSGALARIRQYIDRNISHPSEETQLRYSQTSVSNTIERTGSFQGVIEIDLDLIPSSPPFPAFDLPKIPLNRAKSFNATNTILSSPPQTPLGTRSSMLRTNSYPANLPSAKPSAFNPTNVYYEISDDDEDIRAAIAASLADISSPRPQQTPPQSSTAFRRPDELFRPSPPSSQSSINMMAPQGSQASQKYSEPPSSQSPSKTVRDDTRRMLKELDDLTFKPKNDEISTQREKKSNTKRKVAAENSNPLQPRKRATLTQEEKVYPFLIPLTIGHSRHSAIRKASCQGNKTP